MCNHYRHEQVRLVPAESFALPFIHAPQRALPACGAAANGAGVFMPHRVKGLIALVLLAAAFSLRWALHTPSDQWLRFGLYVVIVLLSAGMKVPMPRGDGTLSVNFPFILLGIVQLSPAQALMLAAISVIAQCRIRVVKAFTFVQIAFNVGNIMVATALACLMLRHIARWVPELAPALCLAVAVYFFSNTVPVALVIGWSTGQSPFKLWRREFPWYLPFYLVGAIVAAAVDLTSKRFGLTTALLLVPVVYAFFRAYGAQTTMLSDRQSHIGEIEALHLRTIEGLAMAIEAKDQNTHDHLLRVRVYVAEIGAALQLEKLEMQALTTAAFLHDIGKLAVPEHIVNKPGKLTQEEFEKMKIHPAVGADILERMRFPYPVAPIVRSHHESWDGTGYPDGLSGTNIPIGARILAVVDCFDALASDRPYRKAIPLAEAMAMIKKRAGVQFDPAVVEVLASRYMELELQARAHRGDILPLDISSPVMRGAAPGAGFEPSAVFAPDSTPPAHFIERSPGGELVVLNQAAPTRMDALHLIAAATQEAQTLFEMSQMLGSSLSTNETISVMSSRLRKLIPFRCFALYLREDDHLSTQYLDGECARSYSKTLIPLGDGISGWVAQNGKPMLNGDARLEPNYESERNPSLPGLEAVSSPMLSALSVPLFDLTDHVFGVVTLYSPQTEAFSRDHMRILQAVEAKFSLSLQNALRFRHAEQEASIDYTTQLPNMRQFFLGMEVQLDRSRRTGEGLAVIVCDLNAFKAVNDRHGHLAGNLLLRAIADGFRKLCRSYDVAARMGGDEFVFLLPGINPADPGLEDGSSQMHAITEAVRAACQQQQLDVEVSVSIGMAVYPVDGETAEELLGQADRRMYLQKCTYYESGSQMHLPTALPALT